MKPPRRRGRARREELSVEEFDVEKLDVKELDVEERPSRAASGLFIGMGFSPCRRASLRYN
jgi:hypothetical protein